MSHLGSGCPWPYDQCKCCQPVDEERSAPPADLITTVAHAIREIDGGYADDWSDCAQVAVDAVRSWDARHAVLAERDDVIELLRQDVARLTRERNEWEANEREQYRKVLELRAELDRVQRMLGRAFPAWVAPEVDPDENVGPCAVCGHDPACGFASVEGDWLCHADDHSCYFGAGIGPLDNGHAIAPGPSDENGSQGADA